MAQASCIWDDQMAYITINFNTGIQCASGWSAPPFWAASTAYTAYWGDGVKPTVANGHHYLCTSVGTSGSSDPFSSSDKNWDVIYDGTVQWTCFDEFTNPTIVTSQPFGHGFIGSLWYMYYICSSMPTDYIDSTYLSGSIYDVNTLSCQHEVASIRYRIYGEGDLVVDHNYTVKETWKDDGGNIIFYHEYTDPWQDYVYLQTGAFIGWAPCWWWAYGSEYDGYEEITEGISTGTNYTITIEVYDGLTQICYKTETFTVKNLDHTTLSWDHIQSYTGAEVAGDFGMEASKYVHDLGTDTWINAWYRQKNMDYNDTLKIDGFEGTVGLKAFRSGYVRQTRSCAGVVDKDLNGPYDFTGADYLRASVEGIVRDADGYVVPGVNIFGTSYSPASIYYGCKTTSDGKYALPFHCAGTYSCHALKNNFLMKTHSGASITQSSKHPASKTTRDFTVANCINRVSAHPIGAYAHIESFAVDQQSVIIPDDPITGTTQIKPTSVGASVVKVKTRRWGTGAAMGTSTGAADTGRGYGSGGFNYKGDMGDAEDWSEE